LIEVQNHKEEGYKGGRTKKRSKDKKNTRHLVCSIQKKTRGKTTGGHRRKNEEDVRRQEEQRKKD
jgi:hypothetical protein